MSDVYELNKENSLTAEASKRASKIVGDKVTQLKEKGKEVAEDLEKQAYDMGEKARYAAKEASDMMQEGLDSFETQAKSHPYIVTGAAFLLGMLAAKLTANRK